MTDSLEAQIRKKAQELEERRLEVIESKASQFESTLAATMKERDELKKGRTSYRTLNSILGDNGQIVELEQERDKANALIEQLEAKMKLCASFDIISAFADDIAEALELICKHREGK